jgi:hypothetical protein
MVWVKGLDQLKNPVTSSLIELLACIMVPQLTTLMCDPIIHCPAFYLKQCFGD